MWIEFLTPYHGLASRQRDVFAVIMSQYFKLREKCDSPAMIRTLLWSSGTRAEMRRLLGMSQPHFQMVLAKLRESGVLINKDDINPRYLPEITPGCKSFEFRIVFDFSTPENRETPADEAVKV